MIGWSLGAGMKRRPLEELLDFPCTYTFKAVGLATRDLAGSLRRAVQRVLGRGIEDDECRVRDSAAGRYQAVTFEFRVENGDELYSVYRVLQADERVKYIL